MIVHEFATTETQDKQSEDIPATDDIKAEDNVEEDNVEKEPEVIPRVDNQMVSTPAPEVSE